MNKFKKFDYNYLLLLFISLLFLAGIMRSNSFFGSSIDWYNQHVSFPEYFRTLFYSSKNIFPSLALNIGGGENIYNISYYGLYSPLLLISFLLPSIKMITYLQVLNILIYLSIGPLFYKLLKSDYSRKVSFFSSLFLMLSTPILFHIHRHYMFISYLPFLLLTLISIRKYFKDGTTSLFIIFNSLLILTSYYYSIPSFLVEVLYFTYLYLKEKSTTFKEYLKKGLPLAVSLVISIGITAFLLLPTIYAIKGGRTPHTEDINLLSLFIPTLDIKNYLYNYYGIGLSLISIISIIYHFKCTDKSKKFLSITLLIVIFIPIIMFILNGLLYVRAKSLIPFIPLIIILLASFLEDIFNNKNINKYIVIIPFIIIFIINIIFYRSLELIILVIDFIFLYLFVTSNKYKKTKYLNIIIGFIFIVNVILSYTEKFAEYNNYSDINKSKTIINTLNSDKDIYRMKQLNYVLRNSNKIYSSKYYTTSIYSSVENKYYKDFLIHDIDIARPSKNMLMLTSSPNIITDSYLGIKYIVDDKDIGIYEKYKKNIYKNPYARSIIYATSNVINIDDYKKIKYPYNLDYLFKGVILDKEKTNTLVDNNIKEEIFNNNIDSKYIKQVDNKTIIKTKKDIKLKLTEKDTNRIYLVKFNIANKKCNSKERSITINGITNKLSCNVDNYNYGNDNKTFNYVLPSSDTYTIDISKGDYVIDDLSIYSIDINIFNNLNKEISNMKFNYNKTVGDDIVGSINLDKDGYLATSIPYDEGYSIYIDGKKEKVLRVNKAFIGSKLTSGRHTIKITYKAPLLKEGKKVSFISLCILLGIIIKESVKRRKK